MKPLKWIKRVLIILAGMALLVIGGKYLNLQDQLNGVLAWIEGLGSAGMVVYAVLYIVACILFIPGSLITLGAGAIYGVGVGSILVSISSTLGATAAFLVGRYVARGWVARKMAGNARFRAINHAVANEGWRIVGLTRLSPIFSFSLLNYAFGLTRISLKEYVLASWIGMMPCTVMYVYIGSLAGDLAHLGAKTAEAPSGIQWTINSAALIATVLITLLITKMAKKALAEKSDV